MYDNENFYSLRKIAILRALSGLGDFLCIIPALRSLRFALPDTEIVLVGLAKSRALIDRFSIYLDRLIEFPGYPGLPEQAPQIQDLPAFFTQMQNDQFDLAIQMHGSGTVTNPLTALFGARINAGFFLPGQHCPDATRFLPYRSHESEVRRYLRLLEFLGIPTQGEALEFPLTEADEQALKAATAAYRLHPGHYICIHPGASTADRRWQAEHFVAVADYLANLGFQIVLTGSTEELPLTQSIAAAMQAESINLAGCTKLGALAALLKGARMLICNDTGVSHLADALQVPSVVIFTDSDVDRWAPLNRELHRVIDTDAGSTPAIVMAEIGDLLQQTEVLSTSTHSRQLTQAK
ncbi:MAG: glycosyltransferase family 9 protein [Leptolyngbyaceae cyanobacterium bins.302]|nr:glycosyltransferase family 9 protein [Leptolyngbyaceae cyanobacterium bins.302]